MRKLPVPRRSPFIRLRRFLQTVLAGVVVAAVLAPSGALATGLFSDAGTVDGNLFSTRACFPDADSIYTAGFSFELKTEDEYEDEHPEDDEEEDEEYQDEEVRRDLRVTVTIRRDHDADCVSEEQDAAVRDATVVLELRDAYSRLVATQSGTTKKDGTYRTKWLKELAAGTYEVRVTSLSHNAYVWNPALDAGNPAEYTVPH